MQINFEVASTRIDVSQLENSLINLVINARDAMASGGTLSIVTATGMGLSMVYGFVRQSKGFIEVNSQMNEGTTFSLFLPRDSTPQEFDQSKAIPMAKSDSQKYKCILLVEDEERVRRLAKRQLERMGHSVVEAVDGYDALVKFGANDQIDLVFSDMIMSAGMTGYDLAMEIRKIRPNFPFLITSGYANELLNIERLSKVGIKLLRKPYTEEELQFRISETAN